MKAPTHHTMTCPIGNCGAKIKMPMILREASDNGARPGYLMQDLTLDTAKFRKHIEDVHDIRPAQPGPGSTTPEENT